MARKHKQEEHENHERWLVSYADFITLLFAFFVVMYSISQVNEGKYRVLSDSLVNAFKTQSRADMPVPTGTQSGAAKRNQPSQVLPIKRTPVQDQKRKQQEAKMKSIAKDILKVLEPLVKGGKVRVTQSSRGVAIEINASLLFESGMALLEPDSTNALTAVGHVLAGVNNNIQVEGYSDNSPISTPQYPSNWELSSARSSSVVRVFTASGVSPERLVAIGYGENKPVDTNDTAEGRSRNRRVTVMILSDVQEGVTEIPLGTQ
ncbi:flagellar motor protein MotD [Sulfurirhabdus autotrophica]|uniref:Chemotaxis protein MotB n=1 Tax=Sulfurirhabdus autotrophica TaxID=1706046 RepID=A0A4R3YEY1_9PROT|nr:flagellar motor protein MotD [Sulfurirhabdus autotrophica]TCV90737.1 chemotaxis protein MotB [Sulfurirhabdus autotrophica]